MTRKQNSRGDFTASHIFYKDGAQVAVPSHVEVQYYTDEMCGKFICERNGDKRHYCSISDDGMTLFTHLALSEKFIGNGQLRYVLIEYVADGSFPAGERACPVPGRLNVQLWTGATDDEIEVLETSTLQSVVNDIQGMQSQIAQLTIANDEVLKVANNTSKIVAEFHDELINKADIDDYYPSMSVGMADNLVGRGDVQDAQINLRPSAGASTNITDGAARIKAIKGNSVVWNQQFPNFEEVSGNYHYNIYVQDGNLVVSSTREASPGNMTIEIGNFVKGHKYLVYAKYTTSIGIDAMYLYNGGYNVQNGSSINIISGVSQIFSCAIEGASKIWFLGQSLDTVPLGTITTVHNWLLIDLTQMFGVGNEPTTIEEFNERKPMNIDEYAYNVGEIISTNVDSLRSVGDNAWDEEWELGTLSSADGSPVVHADIIRSKNFIKVIQGENYCVSTPSTDLTSVHLFYYDEQQGYISNMWVETNKSFEIPYNVHFIKFRLGTNYGTQYLNNITISLYQSGYKVGTYIPYEAAEKDLSWIKQIKGSDGREFFLNGMCNTPLAFDDLGNTISNTDVYDEIRYNRGKKVWEAVKRIGRATNLIFSSGGTNTFRAVISGLKPATSGVYYERRSGIFCNKYKSSLNVAISTMDDKSILRWQADNAIYIKDTNYSTYAEFNAANKDLVIYYELAEPIIVELPNLANLNLDYLVWDFGTEEAIATETSAPFRANIIYEPNAVDDIRWAVAEIRKLKEQLAQMSASVTNLTE